MSEPSLPALPYVDFILSEVRAGNQTVEQAWGRHMHWGYWDDKASPDISLAGYQRAADAMTREHLRDLQLKPNMRIADVGCGLGGTLGLLNDELDDVELIGLNIDPRQIEYARERVIPRARNRVQFVVGDACSLPFDDQSLDVIISVECIFHFPSRKKYFSEVKRVLKPGGRFVVSDFVSKTWAIPFVIALFLPFQRGVRQSYGDAGFPPTRRLYRRLGTNSGLELVSLNDVTKGTIPNYAALPPLVSGTRVQRDFADGLRFLELVTKAGFYSYDLFTYRA